MPDPAGFAPLAARDGEPAFAEPWQAQVLGVAFSLVEAGVLSRAAWSEALGAALARAAAAGAADTQETYYLAVVDALEAVLTATGTLSADTLTARTEAWRDAYLSTPHGHPVSL